MASLGSYPASVRLARNGMELNHKTLLRRCLASLILAPTRGKESHIRFVKIKPIARLAFACALAFGWVSCSRQGVHGLAILNQRPTVELSQVPVPSETTGTYVYELSWAGFDPDGRVTGFFYAVDPPSATGAETTWVATRANRATFVFRSDSLEAGTATRARGFHTVAVYGVDDHGARSPVVSASFTSTTVTPTVQIVSPGPNALLSIGLAPSVHVEWIGDDLDGIGSREPVAYRTRLFPDTPDLPLDAILADPDTLRRRFAPEFAGWDSLAGSVNGAELRNMTPGQSYVYAVVAIDRAGAYSPVFNFNSNLLWFHVTSAVSLGPIITLSSSNFSFTYPSGGIFNTPESYLQVEFPADRVIPLVWAAKPSSGSFVRGYRWAVDLASLDDVTPRADEDRDLAHWSRPTSSTGVTLPVFAPPAGRQSETHFFYLEATGDLGLRSIAVMQFAVVRASFERELLVIDDTWFPPDRPAAGGCVQAPSGNWPMAAELDTFLYAVGDKPYRCYPTGTRSPVGLFAGYAFDTLGTHLVPASVLNLQLLDRYRNIIWLSDINSALTFELDPRVATRPMPLLRAWCAPQVQNPLVTWLQQGGRLWLMGGGAALASLRPYNAAGTPVNVYSSATGELAQGRPMHDWAHWRSEISMLRTFRAARSSRAVGGWSGAPDYTRLPVTLDEKSPATDARPPLRSSTFYEGQFIAEFLSKPNSIIDADPTVPTDPGVAVLDTLYETQGGDAGAGKPVMTLYHGRDGPLFVFSGFPPWYFQRAQAIQLVDFVLQDVWKLQRKPVPR